MGRAALPIREPCSRPNQRQSLREELKQVLMSLLALLECDSDTEESPEKPPQEDVPKREPTNDEKFESLCVAQDWDQLLAHLRITQMALDHGHIMCLISHVGNREDCSYMLGCAVEACCLDYDDLRTSLVPLAIVMPDWARDFFTPEFKSVLTHDDMRRIIDGIWPNVRGLAWFAEHRLLEYTHQRLLLHKAVVQGRMDAVALLLKDPFDITEGMLIKHLVEARKLCPAIYDFLLVRLYNLSKNRTACD